MLLLSSLTLVVYSEQHTFSSSVSQNSAFCPMTLKVNQHSLVLYLSVTDASSTHSRDLTSRITT